jgi:S1-C subfamily serine protease
MRAYLALTAVLVFALGRGPAWAEDPPAPGEKPPSEKPPADKPAERGYLGFTPAAIPLLSADALEGMRLTTVFFGVVVLTVTPNAPAEKAGLQRGDLLLKLAGRDMPDTKSIDTTDPSAQKRFADTFKKLTEGIKPGDTVEFVVNRRGKEMVIKAEAVDQATIERINRENKEAENPKPNRPPSGPPPADRGYVGFEARPVDTLNRLDRKRWNITAMKGIVALNVVPGSPADQAGLKNGDVLVKYAGTALPTQKEIEDAKNPRELVQDAFLTIAATLKAGALVEVVVERDGAHVTLKAVAVDGPTMEKLRAAAPVDDPDASPPEKKEGKPEKDEKPEKPG